jgi:hypothetical protein
MARSVPVDLRRRDGSPRIHTRPQRAATIGGRTATGFPGQHSPISDAVSSDRSVGSPRAHHAGRAKQTKHSRLPDEVRLTRRAAKVDGSSRFTEIFVYPLEEITRRTISVARSRPPAPSRRMLNRRWIMNDAGHPVACWVAGADPKDRLTLFHAQAKSRHTSGDDVMQIAHHPSPTWSGASGRTRARVARDIAAIFVVAATLEGSIQFLNLVLDKPLPDPLHRTVVAAPPAASVAVTVRPAPVVPDRALPAASPDEANEPEPGPF